MSVLTVAALNVSVGGTYLDVILDGSRLSLDESRLPYVVATVVIARPAAAVLAKLDPTVLTFCTVIGATQVQGAAYGGTFYGSLMLTGRSISPLGDTVTLELASEDRRLLDYRNMTPYPIDLNASQSSVAEVVYAVLQRVRGAGTVQAVADAAFPTFTEQTNVVQSGSFEGTASFVQWYVPVDNNTVGTYSTDWAKYGKQSLRLQAVGATTDTYGWTPLDEVSGPGDWTFRGTVYLPAPLRGTLNSRSRRIVIVGTVNGRAQVLGQSDQAPNSAGAWPVEATVTVPKGTKDLQCRVYSGASSGNGYVYWDGISGFEGAGLESNGTPIAYFDYSTRPDLTNYAYRANSGTLDGATTTRIPVVERPPENLVWEPGQGAWDFLEPILTAVGLRLYANESRTFILAPALQPASGTVVVTAGDNLYDSGQARGRDLRAFDGSPLFFDALSIKYTWVDRAGKPQERWDIYAPAGWTTAHQLEFNRPYPGPGAAQSIVAGVAKRKDATTVTARIDCLFQPGMPSLVQLELGGPTLTGTTTSVEHDFGAAESALAFRALA